MKKVRILQAVACLVFVTFFMVFVWALSVETQRINQRKHLEFKQQAQTITGSRWVLASVAGPVRENTDLITVVELSTGRVFSFEVNWNDPAWDIHKFKIGSQFNLKFDERQDVLKRFPTLAGYLTPTGITAPQSQ